MKSKKQRAMSLTLIILMCLTLAAHLWRSREAAPEHITYPAMLSCLPRARWQRLT